MPKQQNEDEYKDDDYAWFKNEMNQTQDNISYSSAAKNRRQRLLNKQDNGNKSFICMKNTTK